MSIAAPQTNSPGAPGVAGPSGYRLLARPQVDVELVAGRLEHLTFPSLRARVGAQRLHEPLCAVAISWGEEPVGLALARGTRNRQIAEIISLYVRRDHRGRGLSRPLMAGLEQLLARQGYRQVQLAYRSDWPARPVIEHRLSKLGWMPPCTNLMLGKFSVPEAMAAWQASPLQKTRLPKGFQVLPWADITETELDSLAQEAPSDYPEELAPLEAPDQVEPLTSLMLRHQGRIIGWMITHRLDVRTIQYTRLHVEPPYQRLGRGLSLMAESIRKQIEAGIPFGVFQVRTDNPRMQALVRRRLQPFLVTWTESRRSEKQLGSPSCGGDPHGNRVDATPKGNDS